MRLVTWSVFVGGLFALGFAKLLALLSVPLPVTVPVAVLTGAVVALDVWREKHTREPTDNARNHALCGWCWRAVVPSAILQPPQMPPGQRVFEKCCRCGHVCFDGIYLHNTEAYPFCDH